jgi:hypothetical protein
MRFVHATAWLLACAAAVPVTAADWPRVELRGTLALPDEAADATGRPARITGVSGVAWLGDDRYVAVLDNSDRLVFFAVRLGREGRPVAVRDLRVVRVGAVHDFEDVVVCPEAFRGPLAAGRAEPGPCLLLAEEGTPAIRCVAQAGGELLGAVPLPEPLARHRPNRGLESLSVDPDDGSIWTANEEALATDGPATREGGGTTVRLVRLPPPAAAQRSARQYAYDVDPPHGFVRIFAGEPLAGVSAIAALGGGRLLVLERSAGPGLPPFTNRLYAVDTTHTADVAAVDRGLATWEGRRLEKRLVWQDALGCNLEGLCLGPPLPAGGRAAIAVADNGGLDVPTRLVVLAVVPAPGGVTSP